MEEQSLFLDPSNGVRLEPELLAEAIPALAPSDSVGPPQPLVAEI